MTFSVAPARRATPARFGLTVDQLSLLERECAGIALPPEFRSRWNEDVPDDERADRTSAAELGLVDQGLVRSATIPSPDAPRAAEEFAARVQPALTGHLGLFAEPALLLAVHSWGAGRTIMQTIAARAGYAASLVRGQRLDAQGAHPANEDAVELSAFPLPDLITELLRSLVRLEPAAPSGEPPTARTTVKPPGSVVLPLTHAQGLIAALRTDNADIIRAAARHSDVPQDARMLGVAASEINAGYSVGAQSLTGDSLAVHWFRGENGWFELSVDTPGRSGSTTELVDSSRVRIAASGPAAIVAQVTTAIGALTGALRG
jgi:hypothetical protein